MLTWQSGQTDASTDRRSLLSAWWLTPAAPRPFLPSARAVVRLCARSACQSVQGVAWGCLGGERKAARISRSCSLILMSHFVKVSNQNPLLRNISGSAAWLLPKTWQVFAYTVFLAVVVVSDGIITNAHTCDVLSVIALIGHSPRWCRRRERK